MFNEYGHFTGKIPKACVRDCSEARDVSGSVARWRKKISFTVPRELAVKWLGDSGAWEREELKTESDETLAQRVLWLACCDIKENGIFFGLCN